ncbi:MAG: hypothetical protein JNM69_20055 [Archangium sp.]|nr:hypothetical protein [Archangium sp.]
MTRLGWISAFVLCACQGQPVLEVSLGGKAFEVKDAVYFSLTHALGPPTTHVVFGDQPGLCQAFEDRRNVCNARVVPDVHDGLVNTLSRPVGVRRPLGWLVLRSGSDGPALVLPDDLRLGTPGASLTEGATPALHATKNHAVIEQLVAGDSATFSFDSELSDGREFRGRVEASWCPALDMVRRYNSLELPAGTSSSYVYDDAQQLTGWHDRAECEGEVIDGQCTTTATSVTCRCLREGVTSTCSTSRAPDKWPSSCCNLRFGD